MNKSKVYFTDLRAPVGTSQLTKLQRLIRSAGIGEIDMEKKLVAIKLHFGEPGNLTYLRPNYAKAVADVVKELGGVPFLTDCNTLYPGRRKNALEHIESAYENGFSPFSTGCQVIIGDGLRGNDDVEVPVAGGEYVEKAKIGRAIMDADGRCIAVCNFDAIFNPNDCACEQLNRKMAEYAKAVVDGRPQFHISLVIDVSPYCDCHGDNDMAILPDVGMFASFDPVALDQACVDACLRQQPIPGSLLDDRMHEEGFHDLHDHFRNVTPECEWESCLAHGEKIGLGSRTYELIRV